MEKFCRETGEFEKNCSEERFFFLIFKGKLCKARYV